MPKGYYPRRPLPVRFWSKVEVRGPDECWEWQAARDRDGYGAFMVWPHQTKAHRTAASLAFAGGRPIPAGLCICHACDNPGCVNPAHLFFGTIADNNRDRDEKGRAVHLGPLVPRRGEQQPRAKLTDAAVVEIRRLRAAGATYRELAADFHVSQTLIAKVARGELWRHVQEGAAA